MTRTPPASIEAEESLLGSVLLSSDAVRVAAEGLVAADFYKPEHARIFQAILILHENASAVDVVTVAIELERQGHLAEIGGKAALARIQADTPASANAPHYAAVIAETATLRRSIALAGEIADAGYDGDLGLVQKILTDSEARLGATLGLVEPGDELLVLLEGARAHPAPDWVIPGCLARGERLMVTGEEGLGKSTLLRQMAVQIACGVHPFDLTAAPRRLCLHVDMENTREQSEEEYAQIATDAVRHKYEPGWLFVKRRATGLDLTSRGDVQWLEAVIAHHQPDVVLIGPLYKMMRGTDRRSIHSEESAAEAANALDTLRVRYGFALIIEAHSPHLAPGAKKRDPRPIGASLWLRWPEFGYGLISFEKGAKLERWRLDRIRKRRWPTRLERGKAWPWVVPDAL